MIATAALALALVGIRGAPAYGRFHHYFQDLKSADANLNPVERVVFSLILANTEQAPQPR
jgi:hypothetical protein